MFAPLPQTLADVPPHTIRPFYGPQTTVGTMLSMIRGPRGERSVLVRQLVEHIVRELQPKDYLGEILACRNFAAQTLKYSNDTLAMEVVKDAERTSEEIIRYGKSVGDCDDAAVWLCSAFRHVGRECEIVIVGFRQPGHYSHTFARVKEPKSQRWIVTDIVAGTNEASMLRRVTTWKSYPV